MKVFDKLKYYEFTDICVGNFIQIGRSKKVYKFIDFAKHWNDNGYHEKLMVVQNMKGEYKVFRFSELEGKKVTVYCRSNAAMSYSLSVQQ